MSTKKHLSGKAGRFSLRKAGTFPSISTGRNRRSNSRSHARLRVELLEDRVVLSPVILDPNLGVRTVVGNLTQPTSMAFLGDNDFIVLEKTTGKVDHVINGVEAATKFDFGSGPIDNLPVNNASERGLLGVALSPDFTNDHDVYLYWTQSSTGVVTNNTPDVPLLGNRVDRFIWNAASSTLTFDRNIIRLHAYQEDHNSAGAPFAGNHNGGILRFGPDGKLYIVIGDNGRRGWLQNLINGPQGPGQTDENAGIVRGGPAPDDAHLTGVMIRLNPDGSIPSDNPFVDIRTTLQASVLSGADKSAAGSFTLFLNQAMNAFTVHGAFQDLSAPAIAGQVRLDSADGPVIFSLPTFPKGLTSGEFTATLTAANFVADPPDGINTLADGVNAVLNGHANFTIYTTQFPTAAISGQISQLDPEITTNLHKVFAYGIRNTFGYTFDPITGRLWLEENGDQSYDKISIVDPGANNGWIQSSGPLFNTDGSFDETALAEFKNIEVGINGLQQIRWPATRIADTVEEALSRLVMLPGAHYNAPVFSFRAEDPPAGIGFLHSSALGKQYQDALFEGEARDNQSVFRDPREQFNGALFVFHPTSDRSGLDFGKDPNIRPSDHVFLNDTPFDLMGDTTFLLGTDFGVLTDVQTGPDGNLWVVSLTGGTADPNGGAVYEVFRKGAGANFHSTNLVANTADPHDSTGQALGAPAVVDPLLVNPWGIAFSAASPFWIANNGTGTSTLYSGTDETNFMKVSLEVSVPPAPTGAVFNGTTDFVLSNGLPARFLFDGLDGSILGWNSGTQAERLITIPGAVYTGLDMGETAAGNFLYAANVSQGRIDVFDAKFQLVTPGPVDFGFADPNLPSGLTSYKPFNVDNLDGTLYVTYRNSADPEHGGIVDAFDMDGQFLRRVVSGGVNAPWGLAVAPKGFGNFGGDLLVGSFGLGDGKINAFDPNTGQFLGYLTDADGNPLAVEGLWYLSFGNGGSGGDPNTLYFTAGINRNGPGSFSAHEGLFGSIRLDQAPGSPGAGGDRVLDGGPLAFNKDLLGALLGPTSFIQPHLSEGVVAKPLDLAQKLPPPDHQSLDQFFGSVQEKDPGTVRAGSKPTVASVDSLGLSLFPANDGTLQGLL